MPHFAGEERVITLETCLSVDTRLSYRRARRMYADASGFEVILDVFPGGDVVASSSDTKRLSAVMGGHVLKTLGFRYIMLGNRGWEHPDGGKRVVDSLQAMAAKDGFRLVVRDKGGLSVLPRKTLAERMREREPDDQGADVAAVLPSGSPTKAMRADGSSVASPRSSDCGQPESSPSTTASTCPPTLERTTARATGTLPSSDGHAASRGSSRRSLAATLDLSTAAPSIVDALPRVRPTAPVLSTAPVSTPAPMPSAAAAPAASAASAASAAPFDEYFDEYCLSDDVLSAALDAAQYAGKQPAAPPTAQPTAQPAAAGLVAAASSIASSVASSTCGGTGVGTGVNTAHACAPPPTASPRRVAAPTLPPATPTSKKISGPGDTGDRSPEAISSFASSVDDPISAFSSPGNSQANAGTPTAAPSAGAPQPPFARAPGQQACKYGLGCYRKQLAHWRAFDHPVNHPFLSTPAAEASSSAPPCHDAGSPSKSSPPLLID